MLVSHRKKFIFTKTVKTAGTSVESYFEKWCMPEGTWQESHGREETVTEAGIIGYRGPHSTRPTWFNHMPADRIRELLGQETWDTYFKFTVVRNPFDKLVSVFQMHERERRGYSAWQRAKALAKKILDRGNPIDRIGGSDEVDRFRRWVHKGGVFTDRDKYLIGERVCIDCFIRFEALADGVALVCEELEIPFDPEQLPEFKPGGGDRRLTADYFDATTEAMVREQYAWELQTFGYDMPG